MARKPQPGGDRNAWGAILNEFFDVSHNTDGTIKPAGVQTAVATEVETALGVQLHPAVVEELSLNTTVVDAAAAAIDAEPRVAANTAAIDSMPTVIAGNYTKRLANYGGDLAAAIADLPDGGINGGEIQVDGEFTLASGDVIVPDGVQVIGRGASATRILLDPAYNWPGLYANGNSNVLFADMTLQRVAGGTPQASQIGVQVFGPGGRIHMERLVIDGFYGGVRVRPGTGYTTGTVDLFDLVMRDVKVVNSSTTYGIEIAGVDGFLLDNCEGSYSVGASADGLKISGKTLNGKVIGGRYNNNAEEGIDAFTGGQNIHFIGVTCDNNTGSGVIVKTDNVTASDPANLAPRNIHFTDMSCKNNGAYGLGVYKMNSGGTPPNIADQVTLANVVINGGEFYGNFYDGIYSDARNVVINNPIVRRNGRHGIYAGAHALHNTINNPIMAANGVNKATATAPFTAFSNKAANIWIRDSQNVTVNGGIFLGRDADNVTNKTTLATAAQYTSYNVRVDGTADFIEVNPDWCDYQAESGTNISTTCGDGQRVILHHKEASSYPHLISGGASGSHGSTYLRTGSTAATIEPRMFTKWNNNPSDTNGWAPVPGSRISILPTAEAGYLGWEVLKDNGASADTRHVCIKTGTGTYAWRAVTLT